MRPALEYIMALIGIVLYCAILMVVIPIGLPIIWVKDMMERPPMPKETAR